jgi:cytosine/uracil/thiamine/allantoin permease
VLAISVDLLGYETFLLLIGGVFVSLFGVMLADYFLLRERRYETAEFYRAEGRYWFWSGVNPAGLLAWIAGFSTYIITGLPPWVVDHFPRVVDVSANIKDWFGLDITTVGGTIPSFFVSLVLYLALERVLLRGGSPRARETAPARV